MYETPTDTIAAGKARVLIANTATVAPADVRLDGTVVFRNIANGEFATADVAEGEHVAELLPSGLTTRPILGPLGSTDGRLGDDDLRRRQRPGRLHERDHPQHLARRERR